MSVIISTTGSMLILTFSNGKVNGIITSTIKRTELIGDDIFIYQNIQNEKRVYYPNPDVIKLNYLEVTPSFASAALLFDYLNELIGETNTDSEGATIVSDKYEEIVHNVNGTNLTANTRYLVLDCEGYTSFAIQLLGSGGVTFTAYMTLSEDASNTNETDTKWEDATPLLFSAASIVDSGGIALLDTTVMPKKILIKYVTSDTTNKVDIWSRRYS